MDVTFRSRALGELCTDPGALQRRFGARAARVILDRIDDLVDAPRLSWIAGVPGHRCEELKGGRRGQLSVRITGGLRMVFEPSEEPVPRKPDGGLDWTRVHSVRILSIEDYHG